MTQEAPEELSERELEILRLVATGATNQQIALKLIISVNTVKAHLRNIFGKLGVESRTEATTYAIQRGLIAIARPSEVDSEAGTAQNAEGGDVPAPTRPLPLAPHLTPWPLLPAQRIALVLAIALIVTVATWPGAQATAPSTSRLVDLPRTSGAEIETEQASRWQAKAQMPTPRGRFAQVTVDRTILVIGGLTEQGWSAQVDAYDTVLDRWERRAPKPTAVANIQAVTIGDRVYVPGGLDARNVVRNILEVYNPATDTWSSAAPLPRALCSYAISEFEGGFYLFGGWDGQRYVDTVYSYDAATNAWHTGVPLRVPRGLAAAATVNGRIYLMGGYDGANEYALCESYDPALAAAGKDPWRTLTSMTTGRAGHSVAVAEGNLYVVGGGWDSYFAYNERYDVANDAWSTFESPFVGEWRTLGLSAITIREGTFLYAMGGWKGAYLSVVEAYRATFRVYLP